MTSGETSTIATIAIGEESTTVEVTDADGRVEFVIPRGVMTLHRTHISQDPPLPEDLTNAIGDMMDHLDDAAREVPSLASADRVTISGEVAAAIAAVEIGSATRDGEFTLTRDAAEDVFRTLATEPLQLRRRNPGLPGELAEIMPAGCCAVVAVLRGLQLDQVAIPER